MVLNLVDMPAPPSATLVPRDGKDRPVVIPRGGGKPVVLARTTTFIDCIEDKSALAKWGKRMVLVGSAQGAAKGILEAAAKLDPTDPQDKRQLDALAERLLEDAGANKKRDKGTELHDWSEHLDRGENLPDLEAADLFDLTEYRRVVLETGLKFSHAEVFTVCLELGTAGTPDRIVWYSGPGPDGEHVEGWFIFDLKTGTVEYGGLKMAAQLAIYSRSELCDPTKFDCPGYSPSVTKKADPEGFEKHKAWKAWLDTEFTAEQAEPAYDDLPPVSQEWGIILNLPSGSATAELYWADLTVGWRAATLATTIREMRSLSGRALRSFTAAA